MGRRTVSVVLDTHAWLWFLNADPRLGRKAVKAIEAAVAGAGAILSVITPWEVAMLAARQRVSLPRPVSDWLEEQFSHGGFVLHPLSLAVAVDSNALPGQCHGDP